MYNLALFGGSFDPIGIHHEKIVDVILKETGMRTWIMPCYNHLFAKGSRLESAENRWKMIYRVAHQREDNAIVPFYWEIHRKHKGSMFETIESLKKAYPSVVFHIVIGMDNANVIESKWDHGLKLIKNNPFIVITRQGVTPERDWFLSEPHKVYTLEFGSSSSAIRESIKNGNYEFAEQNLNPSVFQYIKDNSLYGFKA